MSSATKSLEVALIVGLLAFASPAAARAPDQSGRVGALAGARYIPHGHFKALAGASGVPVQSETPWGGVGLASFGFRPGAQFEVAIEAGYANDAFKFEGSTMRVSTVPIGVTGRWWPLDTAISPYLGIGGGYVLNFFSGAPGGVNESHARGFHALVGASWDFMPRWQLWVEDRYMVAIPGLPPIGEINTGGNMVLIGISFVFAPEPDVAPH